jgi:hypothetical protein
VDTQPFWVQAIPDGDIGFFFVTNHVLDTDSDGVIDALEIFINGTDPNNSDSDGDGLSDGEELWIYSTDPLNADSDGDGLSDGFEAENGGDPNDGTDGGQQFLIVTGDGDDGVEIADQQTWTLPPNSGSYLVLAYVHSDEYPTYTGSQSDYDDRLSWDIQPSDGDPITGNVSVNTLHDEWVASENERTSFQGYMPIALMGLGVVHSDPEESSTIEVEAGVTNIADATRPSTVIVGLLPLPNNDVLTITFANAELASQVELQITEGDDTYVDINPKVFADVGTNLTITGKEYAGEDIQEPTIKIRNGEAVDGHMTPVEEQAIFSGSTFPGYRAPALDLFECASLPETQSMVVLQAGAFSYGGGGPPFRRGHNGQPGVVFARNLVALEQIYLAVAHEIGHNLDLSFANEQGGHDLPPYPPQVESDNPNGFEGEKPGPAYDGTDEGGTPHQDKPSKAIMMSGSPDAEGKLPWLHGRWMRWEDWELANEKARGVGDE